MKNFKIIEVNISDIKVGTRHRKDMGDVEGLAQSIEETGLLQPIGITPDNELVFGERRLRAYRDVMKRETIPARIVEVDSVLLGEFAENMMRKEYTVSERVAIVESLRSFRHGGNRRSTQDRKCDDETVTVDVAAKSAGLGGKDGYARAKKVIDGGVPELVEAMDSGRISVSAAAVLAEAKSEEQQFCLSNTNDQSKVTAPSIERQLRRVRERQTSEQLDAVVTFHSQLAMNTVTQGNCRDLIPALPDDSINLCVTSPPYAEQRKGMYPGIPESEYPEFTVDWMSKLWDKLTDDGSALIVIDPKVKAGVLADYVLRTQLALRDAGWKEHQTQIWLKRDRGPLGHKNWPRHCYEPMLWFSKTARPYCDPWACGTPSNRVGSPNYRYSDWSKGKNPDREGIARSTDVWDIPVGENAKGVDHPAKFPVALPKALISTFCPPGGVVLDNFAGSGSTLIAAKELGHPFYGIDIMPKYVEMAKKRLEDVDPTAIPKAG